MSTSREEFIFVGELVEPLKYKRGAREVKKVRCVSFKFWL